MRRRRPAGGGSPAAAGPRTPRSARPVRPRSSGRSDRRWLGCRSSRFCQRGTAAAARPGSGSRRRGRSRTCDSARWPAPGPGMPGICTPSSRSEILFDYIRINERDTPRGGAAFLPWPEDRGLHAAKAMSLLEVSDLHVWFDLPQGQVHAVQGVSFALDPGERFGLVGESGCGKTTTILAMMGLLPPTASVSGEVRVDGHNILADGEDSARGYRWKDIAMVFQGAMNALNPVKKVGW